MAPVLIDSRDLLKLVLISVMSVMLVFASGFFVGHQRAATFYQAGSEIQPLVLPEKTAVVDKAIGTQHPSKIEAGEEIDVDHPEAVDVGRSQMQAAKRTNKYRTAEPKRGSSAVTERKADQVNVAVKEAVVESRQTAVSPDNVSVNQHASLTVADSEYAIAETAFNSGDLSEIKYSIQVGLYSRLDNAENMLESLQANNLEAYITDYTNAKNETRFNVRYGYFKDKKTAIKSLQKFKSDKDSDGYLVKFSAENIVNLADASADNPAVITPVHPVDAGEEVVPAESTVKVLQDKISQAEVLKNRLTSTN